jgi:hypothetical protein
VSAFDDLKKWLGKPLPSITNARHAAKETVKRLRTKDRIEPASGLPENLGLVAYGSIAREEWTQGSDVDWTLLIDGPADASHIQLAQAIKSNIDQHGFASPGATGTFGAIASSHELVHRIGGTDDTNQNLTRRILLLLESVSINDSIVRDRVLRQVLERYISFDPSVSWLVQPRWRVPRFLLNDVVRFWRTMAVDYAAKKWEQQGGKWALRNAKLRFSRKLLFAKGLLLCLDCEAGVLRPLPPTTDDGRMLASQIIERCVEFADTTAIELLSAAARHLDKVEVADAMFSAYDEFVRILNDPSARESLKHLRFEDASTDPCFTRVRELSKQFQKSLESLFFAPDGPWSRLTMSHGVF